MFYTILPTLPPMFAVQVEPWQMVEPIRSDLHKRIEAHFMTLVVLINWNEAGEFTHFGHLQNEKLVSDEDLVWRNFELPAEPEIPF